MKRTLSISISDQNFTLSIFFPPIHCFPLFSGTTDEEVAGGCSSGGEWRGEFDYDQGGIITRDERMNLTKRSIIYYTVTCRRVMHLYCFPA